jgi:hypothetical protein
MEERLIFFNRRSHSEGGFLEVIFTAQAPFSDQKITPALLISQNIQKY